MSSVATISEETMDIVVQSLKKAGLLITTNDVVVFGHKIANKRKLLMKMESVTAFQVAKYKLINTHPSLPTIKNWVSTKKFGVNETFYNEHGKLEITTMAIRRLNGE